MHSDEQQANGIGNWLLIPVGAALVSSISFSDTVKPGVQLRKGDEHGYFQFGGSTIVLLFDSTRIVWDKDLIDSSNSAVETLIKMGDRIGTIIDPSERNQIESTQQSHTTIIQPSLLTEFEEDECDSQVEQVYGDHPHMRSNHHVNELDTSDDSVSSTSVDGQSSASNTHTIDTDQLSKSTTSAFKSPTKSPLKRNRDIERLIQENERDPHKRKISVDILSDNYLI